MPPVVQALAIAAALLLPVVIFIVVISIAMVKRGEISMHGEEAHAAPVAEKGKAGAMVPRRAFLSWMGIAWTAFAASMVATASATGRFMFPNVLFEPPATFKAGFPDEIQPMQVDERFKQRFGVWL